jgi:hypothetical protein
MPTRLPALFAFMVITVSLTAQPMFSNQSALLPDAGMVSGGVAMAVVDMDGDGLDDIVRFEDASTLRIEFQLARGSFNSWTYPASLNGNIWSLAVADVDGDGLRDIGLGGYNNTQLLKASNTDGIYGFTSNAAAPNITLLQGSNFAPITGGAKLEYFACDDNVLSKAYHIDSYGALTYDARIINPVSTVPSDDSGNYASIWTDYDNDGDIDMYLSKCRLGVSQERDGRRLNQMWQNDGNGNFTDVAGAIGLLPLAQSWASDFADIDNDGDLDCFIVNHDKSSMLLKNDGNGVFTDVTAAMGINNSLAFGPYGIQCNFEDFDNDGYIDLLLTHRDGIPVQLYLNNEGTSMALRTAAQITTNTADWPIQSAATGDLNNDGYVDIYGAYASGFNNPNSSAPDILLLNQNTGNNHLKIQLKGVNSNPDAVGARIMAYDQAWGVQTRELRSGESYGIMNSLTNHFGLGERTVIDSVVIRWPMGLVETLYDVMANQTLSINEGEITAALPLEWQSFSATSERDKRVRLNWSTSQEEGTSHFLVERSKHLVNWASIVRSAADGRPGNLAYFAYDEAPLSGTAYYRIRQVDLDGTFTFSSIQQVDINTEAFTIFPNPASGWLNVRHPTETDVIYSIETLAGTQVRGPLKSNDGRVSLQGLKAGVYLLRAGDVIKRIVVSY